MTEVIEDETMVERVAKAIWMENRPELAPSYDELDFLDQLRVQRIAVACIKVMREPTEEMIEAGLSKPMGEMDWKKAVKISWEAMIDAAIEDR